MSRNSERPGASAPLAPRSACAVEAAGITKSFGDLEVLRDLRLSVEAGTVFALLGPNGAGKTTLINILSTLMRPDGGHAQVVGHDVVREASQVRRRIALTGQYAAVDLLQTGEENLVMMGKLCRLSRAESRRRAANCSSSSTSSKPDNARSKPIRGACAAASIWPRAS